MRFIFKFLVLFFVCESQCFATSTSFEQNLLFNNNNQSLKMNANKSIGNFNALVVTGSISIVGEKLYQTGFLSPLGLVPDNIKNLSPIVYNTKSKPNISGINPICYDSNLNEKYINSEFENTFFDIEIINKCNLIIEENNFKSIDNLISRYF